MSETIEATTERSRGAALSTLRLPELQVLAAELGLSGASGMRKGELVTAIRERRAGGQPAAAASAAGETGRTRRASSRAKTADPTATETVEKPSAEQQPSAERDVTAEPAERPVRARRESARAARDTSAQDSASRHGNEDAEDR
ncbi:Rho termination factor N-terminal domain-containing protein, partial [Actinotalea sp.]|uniref:Rho termination factor N-terminal domain-containing protein n=1 Tax=Actinotalea sp. TaxID=1872145 RepID=UPI003569B664